MKKGLICIGILFQFFYTANAQERKSIDEHQSKGPQSKINRVERHERMAKWLQLTEDQKKQMQQIRDENKKKLELLEQQQTITVKEYNDRKTALRKEMQAKREAVLTKQQKDRIATAKELQQLKKQEMFVKRMGAMKEKLNLTDDQAKQFKLLREKNQSEITKIKNDSKLNDQEKKVRIRTVVENGKESAKKLLTSEQLTKLDQMKEHKKMERKRK